jgi:hypothetical protein
VTPPPVALALAILAMLLAILAAGQPALVKSGARPKVTVVLDRGFTMSARGSRDGVTRLAETFQESGLDDSAERVLVPAGDSISPTALETRDAVRLAVRAALARDATPVFLISDQTFGVEDDRLVQIFSQKPGANARIVTLAARETPAAQVMVRLRGVARAKLRVTSGEQRVERDVSLSFNSEHEEFFDFAKLNQTIRAELLLDDDQPGDNTAWLVREASWPRVESRVPLPSHLQRMLDVYGRQRPPGANSKKLVSVPSPADVPNETPAVILPPASGNISTTPPTEIADHPIMHGVSFSELRNTSIASTPPPPGWKPILSTNGKVLIAAGETPNRTVWVGFDSTDWAKSTDFVVFWANVFNWGGAGGEVFASHPVGSLEGDWTPVENAGSVSPPERLLWPGVYRRNDGTLRAINAPDVPTPAPRDTHWRERLKRLEKQLGQVDLSPWLALAALVCLCGSALLWKRRPVAA